MYYFNTIQRKFIHHPKGCYLSFLYLCNETYNETSMTFEVHIHIDQGEGYDWIEDWCIDEYGRIYSEDDIYESYEEFLREWV